MMALCSNKELSCLPENVIYDILSYLPVKERCIAGRVCKRWRQIIASNSLWRHVDLLEYKLNLPRMWKILRAHFTSSLLSLRISGYAHSNFTKASVSDALLKDLQTKCPSIHTLHLHDCNTSNLSVDCVPATLTCLYFTHSSWQPRWMKGGHSHLPNLTKLDLSNSVRVDNFDLQDIAQWTGLKALSLSGCYRIKGSSIELVAKALTDLEILNLNSTGVDELGIHHIARHCKNLTELYLQNCANMKDSWLAEISSGLSKLRVLDVSSSDCLSLEGVKVLWTLKNLKELTVGTKKFKEDEIELIKIGFIQNIELK